jgi:hypothetical protein
MIAVLVNDVESAGTHRVVFDATDLASGSYIYILKTPDGMDSKTMFLTK